MFCLDSDFLIALLREDKTAVSLLYNLETESLPLTTTPVQAMELFRGAYKSTESQDNIQRITNLLNTLEILPIDLRVADRYAQIQIALQRAGKIIGDFDLIIAAVVLNHGGLLVTRNTRHFEQIAGLALKSW